MSGMAGIVRCRYVFQSYVHVGSQSIYQSGCSLPAGQIQYLDAAEDPPRR